MNERKNIIQSFKYIFSYMLEYNQMLYFLLIPLISSYGLSYFFASVTTSIASAVVHHCSQLSAGVIVAGDPIPTDDHIVVIVSSKRIQRRWFRRIRWSPAPTSCRNVLVTVRFCYVWRCMSHNFPPRSTPLHLSRCGLRVSIGALLFFRISLSPPWQLSLLILPLWSHPCLIR